MAAREETDAAGAAIRDKLVEGVESTIKGTLVWKGNVVGSARVKKTKAGTYVVKVNLSKKWTKTFKRQGRKKVTLRLKLTVVGNNKATKSFSSGVIVRI